MGLDGHGFLLLTADGVALGYFLGGMPHGHVDLREAAHQAGVGRDVEAAHGHAGHGFHTSAEEGLASAKHDLSGGEVHRGHGGAAEAVDRGAAEGLGEAGAEAGDAGDVHALLGLWVGATHDHVLQLAGVEIELVDQALQYLGRQVIGAQIDQATFLGEVEGGAGVAGDHDGSHRERPGVVCGYS